MEHTAIIQKYDDDHDQILLDEAMLSELDLKVGDDVVITFEDINEAQVVIRVTPARDKSQQSLSVLLSPLYLIRRGIALYRRWRGSNQK